MRLFSVILLGFLVGVQLLPGGIDGYKILTILYLANGSMRNFFDPILLELAKRNNSVKVITSTPATAQHENMKELEALDIKKMVKGLPNPDFINMRLTKRFMNVWLLRDKWVNDCEEFHKTSAVQKLLKSNEKYDLIFLNSYMNECTYGLAHHLNASTVLISAFPVQPWLAEVAGTPSPLSFVNNIYFVPESTSMGLIERIGNIYKYLYNKVLKNYYYIPAIEKVYRKFIPNAPGVHEIERNASLIMGAGHFSFSPPRPTMPGIVDELAGLHCREPKPLTKEVNDLIMRDGKPTDFIYFSFGSLVQGHKLPQKYRNAFLNAFSRLNVNVLWKWEIDYNETESLPPNVKMLKWFPQQDVLGHPNCKLFITHGGISSLYEAIYHGVLIIGIPFFTCSFCVCLADQDWNLKQAENIGVGVKLELADITEERLSALFHEFLDKPTYQEKAEARSRLFRDRPLGAVTNAVWWVEHVLKHGGALHLRSPARDLNFIQYYSLDITLLLVLSVFIAIFAFYFVLKHSLIIISSIFKQNTRKIKRSKKRN